MEYRKLDNIYKLILDSNYTKLDEYNKKDIDIVIKLRFNNITIPKYINKEIRTGGSKFRETIINKYQTCPLTGISSICEAAHIYPYSNCNELEKYNENNGILLSPNMHKAFDKNYFTIDENTCRIIILNNTYNNNIGLENIKNKYISQLDNFESKLFLKKRNSLIKIDLNQ